jgi:hypothetical protein
VTVVVMVAVRGMREIVVDELVAVMLWSTI